VPFGSAGAWVVTVVVLAWIALGTVVAVAPGLLEHLIGIDYDFAATWGLSQATVESFTLGTLAVLAALAVGGYLIGRRERARDGA
jgi:hypothetical protein